MPSAKPKPRGPEIKSKIDRETLLKGLECVAPAVETSGDTPEFKHIWFDGKEAFAYGKEGLGLRTPLPTEFMGGVLGSTLLGLLRTSSTKEVALDVLETKHDAALQVKAGRSRVVIPIMDINRAPWRFDLKGEKGKALALDLTAECLEGLKRSQAVKPKDPRRVEHFGVTLFPTKDDLELYSTDGAYASQIIVKQKVARELRGVVLPHAFVHQVVKYGKPGVGIELLPNCLTVKSNGMRICSNLLDSSDVPDMPDMVNRLVSGKEQLAKLPEDFAEALKRAAVLVGDEKAYVTLAVQGKELSLTAKFAKGVIDEQMPLSSDTDEGEIEVSLPRLSAVSALALEFAITKSALILMGEDDALFLLAKRDEHARD